MSVRGELNALTRHLYAAEPILSDCVTHQVLPSTVINRTLHPVESRWDLVGPHGRLSHVDVLPHALIVLIHRAYRGGVSLSHHTSKPIDCSIVFNVYVRTRQGTLERSTALP